MAFARTEIKRMDNQTTDSQAMTEVALGLAMAFFAMMILAMLSMSVPSVAQNAEHDALGVNEVVEVVASNDSQGNTAGSSDDTIIIYYQGRYMNLQLEPLDVTNLNAAQKYVLALAPDLPLTTVLAARSKISTPNLVITELDEAWLSRLAL